MGRKAKPLQQQVALLRKRGMIVADEEKACRILLEIGWYRMSFYWFPFETRYPDRFNLTHRFVEGTTFDDALLLYAFDFNLRHALLKPLERIETAFRTFIIYSVSTRYPDHPEWMADPKVVSMEHARQFERSVYQPLRRNNPEIALHHRRFPRDRFAPAWKTLEFMTFGGMCMLYEELNSDQLKTDIARHFGIHNVEVFENYIDKVKTLRNLCAHGNILFSHRPGKILRGPALNGKITPPDNLGGALSIVEHFLGIISERLLKDFRNELAALRKTLKHTPHAEAIVNRFL